MCGFEDDLTQCRVGCCVEITGNRQDIGEDHVLDVRQRRTGERIAPLAREPVIVSDAPRQLAGIVVVVDGTRVNVAAIKDMEGARATSTDEVGVDQALPLNCDVTLADCAVADSCAGLERRWRRRERLGDRLAGEDSCLRREREQGDQNDQE